MIAETTITTKRKSYCFCQRRSREEQIIFRKVEPEEYLRTGVMAPAWAFDEECGTGRWDGHWYIELYDTPLFLTVGTVDVLPLECPDDCVAGRAFVTEYRNDPALLEYLLVDQWKRRRGIGTKLIEACISRWPDIRGITSCHAITPAGEKFCEALEQEERDGSLVNSCSTGVAAENAVLGVVDQRVA